MQGHRHRCLVFCMSLVCISALCRINVCPSLSLMVIRFESGCQRGNLNLRVAILPCHSTTLDWDTGSWVPWVLCRVARMGELLAWFGYVALVRGSFAVCFVDENLDLLCNSVRRCKA